MLDVKDENKILSGQGYDGYIGALLESLWKSGSEMAEDR